MGVYRRYINYIAFLSLVLILIYLCLFLKDSTYLTQVLERQEEQEDLLIPSQQRYLSYQPPGNGWNNQRIVIEMAMTLAKLLNRTLIVHPLSSHLTSERLKQSLSPSNRFGYLTYNKMSPSNLLPLSTFLDLQIMSKLIPVLEVNTTHSKFIQNYSNVTWLRICHSMGYGYWLDRHPRTPLEVQYISKQVFKLTENWQGKCPQEKRELKDNRPIVRYVSDLLNNTSDMIYFEDGSLFGIQLRFLELVAARKAQEWIVEHFQYRQRIYDLVNALGLRLGKYNAVHVRRVKHISKQLTPGYWIVEMLNKEFTKDIPIYISTDEPHLKWFEPLSEAGFNVYFAANFTNYYNLSDIPHNVRKDMLGMYEQLVCVRAQLFVPSPHSTFSNYILRQRGETNAQDGLLYDNVVHTAWVGHRI